MTTKTCPKCKQARELSSFHSATGTGQAVNKAGNVTGKLYKWCEPCRLKSFASPAAKAAKKASLARRRAAGTL